jgi:hypothetical protein
VWVAIDIDPHMTRAAATRLRGFANASVKTADATAMPFPMIPSIPSSAA